MSFVDILTPVQVGEMQSVIGEIVINMMREIFLLVVIPFSILIIFTFIYIGILFIFLVYMVIKGKSKTNKHRKKAVKRLYCLLGSFSIIISIFLHVLMGLLLVRLGQWILVFIGGFLDEIGVFEYFGIVLLLMVFPLVMRILIRYLLKAVEKGKEDEITKALLKNYFLSSINSKAIKQSINIFYVACIIIYSVSVMLPKGFNISEAPVYLAILTFLAIDKTGAADRLQMLISHELDEKNEEIINSARRKTMHACVYYIKKGEFPDNATILI